MSNASKRNLLMYSILLTLNVANCAREKYQTLERKKLLDEVKAEIEYSPAVSGMSSFVANGDTIFVAENSFVISETVLNKLEGIK